MVVCGYCRDRESGPRLAVCEKNSDHQPHKSCLQALLNSIGTDISALACPSCDLRDMLSMRAILNCQSQGIVLPGATMDAIGGSIMRRRMIEKLRPEEKLA